MDKMALVGFIEKEYRWAQTSEKKTDIKFYAANCFGACAYECERSGDTAALDLWSNEWRDKFNALLKK